MVLNGTNLKHQQSILQFQSGSVVFWLQWKRRYNVEILVGECSLFSNYLQSSFLFGVGTAFTHLSF